jgi:chemotaxis protein CheC
MSVDRIDEMQVDMLREICNIGTGNAVTSLSEMIDKEVHMDVPTVKIISYDEIEEFLGDTDKPFVGVLVKPQGDIDGNILFLVDEASAVMITGMLFGGIEEEVDLAGEMAQSALKEIGNIIISSYINALAEMTGLSIMSSIPGYGYDMVGAIFTTVFIEAGQTDNIMLIETRISQGDNRIQGHFFFVPEPASLERIYRALLF